MDSITLASSFWLHPDTSTAWHLRQSALIPYSLGALLAPRHTDVPGKREGYVDADCAAQPPARRTSSDVTSVSRT